MKQTFLLICAAIISGVFSCNQPALKKKSSDPQVLLSQISTTAEINTLNKKEVKDGWQLLFNGKDFTGWHGYNMKGIPECWTIEDNSLTMTTTGGAESQDIITNSEYKNFAFSVEFKLTKAANSGIIFQVREDTMYKFPYETGPEFQVIDHVNWPDSLHDWQICGANYAMHPPKAKPYKPLGEWNQALIVVNNNKVTYFLNGVETVEYEKYSASWKQLRESGKWSGFPDYGKYDEGHISLQNHGTKVWYRNVKIKVLS